MHYVCVDWGTSRFRAALCEFSGTTNFVRDTLSGPGIKAARHSVEETLFELISAWTREHGQLPILLAGAVGSNIGWRKTPYLACPFRVQDISKHCTTFSARGSDIAIVPGLECTNSFGESDMMRGEELQILGWLHAEPSRQSGLHVVCLPGTHTKWVLIEDGRIRKFQTAVTGELYGLMLEHSILLAQNGEKEIASDTEVDAFFDGVAICRETEGSLLHSLFSVRSRLLKQRLNSDAAASYLSGMLIGADVMGALDLFGLSPDHVFLVGEPTLCERFSSALHAFGLESEAMDGNSAATQGFSVVYRDLYQPEENRSASA